MFQDKLKDLRKKNPFRFVFKCFVRDIKEEGRVLFIGLFLFAVHDKRFYTSFKKRSLKHAKVDIILSNLERGFIYIPSLEGL